MTIKTLLNTYIFRKENKQPSQPGFGTFFGVYLPGILAMFGVIIYLRLGWILGNLGLVQTLVIISLACFLVFVTVLSIASAATNRHVGGGGTYYMVSRSLGIEVGSAIGVPLFIAQALAISFGTVGFAESIQPYFPTIPVSYLGAATLLGLLGLVYSSASIALKSQLFILFVIVASLISLFLGKEIPAENGPEVFSKTLSTPFWVGFALFFPAATGVESGVSMSGNLRSPSRSLPTGTIAVLITGFLAYICIPLFLWTHASQGQLASDPLIFQHIARFQPLIIAGIWAATLSTSLNGLLAAPRTLQALAVDKVFPEFLAKEWGKNKEPRVATLFCFAIAMAGVCFGSIDKIAPILTMFYLIGYATLNLATGLEGVLGNPSWRPTFRVHWSVSIFGVILCLVAMFMIDPGATIVALLFIVGIYLFMKKRNLAKRWEDIQNGILVFLSRFAIYRLAENGLSSRSWRPNFIVFSENPMQVNHMVNITSAICQRKGFLTLASIFSPHIVDHDRAERWKKMINAHLKQNKIEALVEFCMDESLLSGAKKLLTNYGIGSVSPDTLVLGEMKRSATSSDYFGIIHAACQAKKNVIIVRDKNASLESIHKIHVWWDDLSRPNSELMLLLSCMLTSNKTYKNSTIELNSIVSNEAGKEQRLKYFNTFISKGRIPVTPHIHVRDKEVVFSEFMCDVSANADLVLIGMNPPNSNEETAAFENYYHSIINQFSKIPNAVFVISSDSINISEIFN